MNKIQIGSEAKSKLMSGVTKLAEIVKTTMGPKGHTVIIEREFGNPLITKDGVTVAKAVGLEDSIEALGAKVVLEVANNTNTEVGDGTTTSIVLAEAMLRSGYKLLELGVNPVEIKKVLNEGLTQLVSNLKEVSHKVSDDYSELKQIASISANGDEVIGELIKTAVATVGKEGVVVVEKSKSTETEVKVIEGTSIPQGLISPYFMTDPAKGVSELSNPLYLITNHSLFSSNELVPILEYSSSCNRPLVIIANNIEGELLQTLAINHMRGTLKVAAIKAPSMSSDEELKDLTAIVGATFIDAKLGMKTSDITPDNLGSSERVTIKGNETIIINGESNKEEIEYRLEQIERQLEEKPSVLVASKLNDRKARLAGGICVIYVGGKSEIEQKELKDRIDDALGAAKSALVEGFVAGGGIALYRACQGLDYHKYQILYEACKAPLIELCKNAGTSHQVLLEKVEGLDNIYEIGMDLTTGKIGNLLEMGVIDSVQVLVTALTNAVSVVSTLLTTDSVITLEKNKESKD